MCLVEGYEDGRYTLDQAALAGTAIAYSEGDSVG
jgi:hypothetical protein